MNQIGIKKKKNQSNSFKMPVLNNQSTKTPQSRWRNPSEQLGVERRQSGLVDRLTNRFINDGSNKRNKQTNEHTHTHKKKWEASKSYLWGSLSRCWFLVGLRERPRSRRARRPISVRVLPSFRSLDDGAVSRPSVIDLLPAACHSILNSPTHTHTHTERERERERTQKERRCFLFLFFYRRSINGRLVGCGFSCECNSFFFPRTSTFGVRL